MFTFDVVAQFPVESAMFNKLYAEFDAYTIMALLIKYPGFPE